MKIIKLSVLSLEGFRAVLLAWLVLIGISSAIADTPKQTIIGRWVCQDGSKRSVTFRKDGTCSVGWDAKGSVSTYKITPTGDVETTTHGSKGSLTVEHFWLKGGVLTGIRGGFGNPRVTFKQVAQAIAPVRHRRHRRHN